MSTGGLVLPIASLALAAAVVGACGGGTPAAAVAELDIADASDPSATALDCRPKRGISGLRRMPSGGSTIASKRSASGTSKNPRMKMTKTAGPSALSALLRSRPQAEQLSATVKKPSNTAPRPQRGHLHFSPADIGETRDM